MIARAALALVFALLLGGCTESPEDGFDALLAASNRGDADALFLRFDRASREKLEHFAAIGASGDRSAKDHLAAEFKVRAVERIEERSRSNNRALIDVYDLDGNKQEFDMRFEDGMWRVHLPEPGDSEP